MIYLPLYILTFFLSLWNCIAFDISIPNEKYGLHNLSELIKQYSILHKTINIYLTIDYYEYTEKQLGLQIQIPSDITVNIYGNPVNGTFIDLTKRSFFYSFELPYPGGQKIKFENITFYNFISPDHILFYSNNNILNYSIQFKNCIFDTSQSVVFQLDCEKNMGTTDIENYYQVTFDSCQFK
ncbi:hypothetical protein H8356DRAFT_1402285 [Neocallimastix lanati (nom. inval.)]|nr:hypothetical protein H8356DRAFT_1402285 [Neocallimastix sp. JGI-2020a]